MHGCAKSTGRIVFILGNGPARTLDSPDPVPRFNSPLNLPAYSQRSAPSQDRIASSSKHVLRSLVLPSKTSCPRVLPRLRCRPLAYLSGRHRLEFAGAGQNDRIVHDDFLKGQCSLETLVSISEADATQNRHLTPACP